MATDNVGHVEQAPATADAETTVSVGSWTNTGNVRDVSNADDVSPLEALQIINELNDPQISLAGGRLPIPASAPRFYDVNEDGFISPVDALNVINFLNVPTGGEGESSAPLVRNTLASLWDVLPRELSDADSADNRSLPTNARAAEAFFAAEGGASSVDAAWQRAECRDGGEAPSDLDDILEELVPDLVDAWFAKRI